MRIAIDNVTPSGGLGGTMGAIRIYLPNILQALLEMDTENEYVLFTGSGAADLFDSGSTNFRKFVCPGVPRSRLLRVLYEQTIYPSLLKRTRVDVFVGTHNIVPLALDVPSVVVLRSLQYLIFPEYFSWLRRTYLKTVVGWSLRRAGAVIAVSSSTPFHKLEVGQAARGLPW